MPGIDCRAPDLTERSRGLFESPNLVPIINSTLDMFSFTSLARLSGKHLLLL